MKSILLILGAGSSKAVDKVFPVGIELAKLIDHHLINTIKEKNDEDYDIECPYISPMVNEIHRIFKNKYNYDTSKLNYILDGFKRPLWAYVHKYIHNDMREETPAISIDQIVSQIPGKHRNQITDIAKFCIAYHLKGSENAFYFKNKNDFLLLKNNWVYILFEKLKSQFNSLEELIQNLHIRTFNYERLFEFCAKKALSYLYDLTPKEAEVLNLNITHVYGSLGKLSDLNFEKNNDETNLMLNSYKSIKLIGERTNYDNFNISEYDKVFFFGFSYNIDNLENALNIKPGNKKECFGTCYQAKDSYLESIDKKYNIRISETKDFIAFFKNYI